MSFNFNRDQVINWTKLNDQYAIDFKTKLGSGSYGIVFRGYSFKKDSLIAIKTIKKNKQNQRQITILETLSSLVHQSIMGYYGNLIKDDQVYLFLQYCPKGTLKQFIKRGLSQLQVLRLFRQLVEGMCYINAKKKMHRDLKPENILIGPEQDIKISDFGLSQHTTSIFLTGAKGTPLYAGPQVYLNASNVQRYTQNCDVWSAGLILYEMLKGQQLFKEVKVYEQLKQQWMKLGRGIRTVNLGQKYHPIWNCFINWMLDFDAKRRPTFTQVLPKIKLVYQKLQMELTKGIFYLQQPLQKFQNYLQFNVKKYQLLLNLCQSFTAEDINIRNEFKFFMMFCCLMRYVTFFKIFLRNLNYKRLKFNNKELIDQSLSLNPYLQLFIIKTKTNIELKYDFYHHQIKITIIPKILDIYDKREQSGQILKDLKKILEQVRIISKGEYTATQQLYEQYFKSILSVVERYHHDVTKYFKLQQLKIYYNILLAMLITEKYPIERFNERNLFEQETAKINSFSTEELISKINSLKNEVF